MAGPDGVDGADGADDLAAELGEFARVYGQAEGTIFELLKADPKRAFAAASSLTETLRQATITASELRARAVARIWDSDKMSLSGLAGQLGVSKARADQLVRGLKAASAKTPDSQRHAPEEGA
ncbi:MAG TPA: hypothetical protein VGM53_35345 [Streptosporangiaceae bacterium]|jgi:hypothetical protein